MPNPLISIAIHSGKREYYPLLENLLKSFLVCNTYPEVEIILLETAQNFDIRQWFLDIDFNDKFVNFDGTKTSIEKTPGTNIQKKALFLNYDESVPWFTCYMDAMNKSVKESKGEYFAFLAEDNQFFIKGNIFQDYVALLEGLGKSMYMTNLSGLHGYKYTKKNNSFSPPESVNNIMLFKCNYTKWDPTYFCHKSIYKALGKHAMSTVENPHQTIEYFSKKAQDIGLKRCFKHISAVIWMQNNKRDQLINKIKKRTLKNPDYILYKISTLEEVKEIKKHVRKDQLTPFSGDLWKTNDE